MITAAFSQPFDYPEAREGEVVDDYFGTKVPDPYRWLEDPDSPETVAWAQAENRLISAYVEKLSDRASFQKPNVDFDFDRYETKHLLRVEGWHQSSDVHCGSKRSET